MPNSETVDVGQANGVEFTEYEKAWMQMGLANAAKSRGAERWHRRPLTPKLKPEAQSESERAEKVPEVSEVEKVPERGGTRDSQRAYKVPEESKAEKVPERGGTRGSKVQEGSKVEKVPERGGTRDIDTNKIHIVTATSEIENPWSRVKPRQLRP